MHFSGASDFRNWIPIFQSRKLMRMASLCAIDDRVENQGQAVTNAKREE
jgi:hypothetical protein